MQSSSIVTFDLSSVLAPEATGSTRDGWNHLVQSTWSYPRTNRLLLQAGASIGHFPLNVNPDPSVTPQTIAIQELSTGLQYNARAGLSTIDYGNDNKSDNINQRLSVSYVTGSHAFKTGVFFMQGIQDSRHYIVNCPLSITDFTWAMNWSATAPSMRRWSKVREMMQIERIAMKSSSSVSTTTGRFFTPPTPRIATCG